MSMLNANPQGTLFGYWAALTGAAVLSTCFFGPPLADCYMRRPVLDGIYQVAGLIAVVVVGISLRRHVLRSGKTHRVYAGIFVGCLSIPSGFALMAVHRFFFLVVQLITRWP